MLTALSLNSYAQKQNLPLKITLLDENFSLPNFAFTGYPLNPAIMIGTEYQLKEVRNHEWYLNGNIGFYHHKHWQNAVLLTGEIGYRQHFGRFNAAGQVGLGYAHVFAATPIYTFSEGTYKRATDFGSPRFMPNLSLHLGYELTEQANSPEIYLSYMATVETSFIPIPHTFVGIGVKFYPFK